MMVGAALLLLASAAAVQGDGIRLEFDGQMRSRVVATSGAETALGPFTESETLADRCGRGRRLHAEERSARHRLGCLWRRTAHDAPGRVRLDRQGSRSHGLCRAPALALRPCPLPERRRGAASGAGLHQPPLRILGRRGSPRAGVLVLPERLVRGAPGLGAAARRRLQARQLPRHERIGLRRRHAGRRRLAPRRRARDRPPRARAQARLVAGRAAEARRRHARARR